MYPAILHAPSKDSLTSTLVMTDALNQKVEHSTIRWEDLKFPTDWVIDTPKSLFKELLPLHKLKKQMVLQSSHFPQSQFSRSTTWPKPSRPPPPIPPFVYICLYSL
jgi:hypothetical protein